MNASELFRKVKPPIKRPPLFLLREIAAMFGVEELTLRAYMGHASRKGRYVPEVHVKAGSGGSVSNKRNYYRKQDFVKFFESSPR